MIRAVQIGDLHLAPGPRNADRRAALDYVIDRERGKTAVWLLPGDLNDAAMTIDDRNWLAARIAEMAATAPVVLCYGNHDKPGDLDVFARLKTRHPVVVFAQPDVVDLDLGDVDLRIFVLPYPNKANLVAAGLPHDQIMAAATEALDAIFIDAGARLDAFDGTRGPALMIGHVNVAGATASTGQPQIGREIEISAVQLARLGDVPILLNHIHKHQAVGRACYAGSLCRLNWGEIEEKGYQVVTFDTATRPDLTRLNTDRPGQVRQGSADKAWSYRIDFVPIDVPPMWHVEGTLTRDGWKWRCTEGPDGREQAPPSSWDGCDVRVRARYAQAERDVIGEHVENLRAEFLGARVVKIEPIAVPDRAVRAAEVVEAATFDDKLRAWAHLMKVDWSATFTACATRLQSPGGSDAIVADVEARLGPLADLTPSEDADPVADAAFSEFMLAQEDAE